MRSIFYNFTKDVEKITFNIKFEQIKTRVIFIYYLNEHINNRSHFKTLWKLKYIINIWLIDIIEKK